MDYVAIFEGKTFEINGDTWTAHVENVPGASAQNTDRRCFILTFRKANNADTRRLKLWASDAGIHVENQIPKLYDCVKLWLQSGAREGEVECSE